MVIGYEAEVKTKESTDLLSMQETNDNKISNNNVEENVTYNEITNESMKINIEDEASKIWQIEIPKINLKAPIAEGTTEKVMNEYVGHFESTSKLNGNIGLAAHNRGYPVNYFAKLKNLVKGDIIIYRVGSYEKTYKVTLSTIIEDTNWDYLQPSQKNEMTLITCVENEPSKRRCIKAIEILKEETN